MQTLVGDPGIAILATALVLDRTWGELPARMHPVVWMGAYARALENRLPRAGNRQQLWCGGFVAVLVPSSFAIASVLALEALRAWPVLYFVGAVVLVKSSFAVRALGCAAREVRDALARAAIAEARSSLRNLCSRDASHLDEPRLVAATIESVAENTSDSFVAPLFYYVLFGLPGAMFYRAVNTLDAMIGYHGRYEYFGKVAARLDDALNYVPARLTAALLLVAGGIHGRDPAQGWRVWQRDAGNTESPNAGRPMATMAGLLRVELEKPNHYVLGTALDPLAYTKIDDAWAVAMTTTYLAAGLAFFCLGVLR